MRTNYSKQSKYCILLDYMISLVLLLNNKLKYIHDGTCNSGADPGFFKGGSQGNGYIYKLYYIHIAIIHIIILNEVYCNLLKPIDA